MISIVTTVYNSALFLRDTVESVRAQTVTDWEHILLDDGSQDDSADLARRLALLDPRLRAYSQPNSGMAAARNAAYLRVDPRSEYIMFLDGDDKLEPDALSLLLERLKDDGSVVAAYGLSRYFGDPPSIFQPTDLEEFGRLRLGYKHGSVLPKDAHEPLEFGDLLIRNWIITPGQVLMRRSVFDAVGGFDQSIALAADWDMWIRISRHGSIAFVNKPLLNYRIHAGSSSKRIRDMERHASAVRMKAIDSPHNSPLQRQAAVRLLRYSLTERIRGKFGLAVKALRKGMLKESFEQLTHTLRPLAHLMSWRSWR